MITMLPTLLFFSATPALPVYFERNVGQAPAEVLARARSGSTQLDATAGGLSIAQPGGRTRLAFDRAAVPAVRFEEAISGKVRYAGEHTVREVPAFRRAVLESVWPGIDVVLLERRGQLAFDLLVDANADLDRASFIVDGAASVDRESGALVVRNAQGTLVLEQPIALQNGRRVDASYEVRDRRVSFRVSGYDPRQPLVIDPIIQYGTYLPSAASGQGDIVSDGRYVYFAAPLATMAGTDPFVYLAKLDLDVTGAASLVWATNILANNPTAASQQIQIQELDVSSSGRLLVCAVEGFNPPFVDTDDSMAMTPRRGNAAAVVMSADGTTLEHVSSFGDSGVETCAWDTVSNNFYMAGRADFGPPAVNSISGMNGWGYLVGINPDDDPLVAGDDIFFSTRLGTGSTLGYRMTVDPAGILTMMFSSSNSTGVNIGSWVGMNSFQTRQDEVGICKFSPALGANALLACTYFGGSGAEQLGDMTTDAFGNVYILVENRSLMDFPSQPNNPTTPANGLVLARINADLASFEYSYFFPENPFARARSVEVLSDGSVALLDGYVANTNWVYTACRVDIPNGIGAAFGVVDSIGQNLTYGTKLPGLAATELESLSNGRIVIFGGIQADMYFQPYVNGYTTMMSTRGLLVLGTDELCMDLQASGTASSNLPKLGDTVTFSIEALNAGPDDAHDVTMSIAIPSRLELVEITTNLGTCTSTVAGSATCTFGTMTNTASAAIELITIARMTGPAALTARLATSDTDLDAMNDEANIGVSIGVPAGPCGAVSIYGECMGDMLQICRSRNTMNETLETVDCAAMNAACRAAVGTREATCEMLAPPDSGVVMTEDAAADPDAMAPPGMDATVSPAADAGTRDTGSTTNPPDEMSSSGCDCSTAGHSSLSLAALLVIGVYLAQRRSRSVR